jgi:hypothetical protein
MLQSRDFKELLKLFEKHEVRYLVAWQSGRQGGAAIGELSVLTGNALQLHIATVAEVRAWEAG